MELRLYLGVLSRRAWLIGLVLAMTLAGALLGLTRLGPRYSATATLRIAATPAPGASVNWDDLQYADRLMNTYREIAASPPLLADLARKLGRAAPPPVEISIPANTELLQITATDSSPAEAARAANTLADLLIAYVRDRMAGDGQTIPNALRQRLQQLDAERGQGEAASAALAAQRDAITRLLGAYEQAGLSGLVRADAISVIEPAAAPLMPSSPNAALILGVALLVGALGGVAAAFLLEQLDPAVQTTEQLAAAHETAILATIPAARRPKSALFAGGSPQHEAIRRLRGALLSDTRPTPLRTILVTSAEPGEGKSTVVANLALALGHAGRSAIVVDCDMRRPTIGAIFGLPGEVGLSSILREGTPWRDCLRKLPQQHVAVITSGPIPPDPAALLASPALTALLAELTANYDLVLLDSPAALAVSDTLALAPAADGVLAVVALRQSRRDAVQAMLAQLREAGTRPLGIVVNHAEKNRAYEYYRRVWLQRRPQRAA